VIDEATLLFITAVVVLAVFGFALASSWLPPKRYWLALSLTPGIGAGVCAIVFFTFRRAMFTVEYVLLAGAIVLIWRRRREFKDMKISEFAPLAVSLPAVAIAMLELSLRVYRFPHGYWDGWAIWNWEARLLYRAGPHWRQYLPLAFHGDYPLLVSSTTARFWRYMGTEVPEAGACLGILLALCSIAVLAVALSELRGRMVGTVMGLTLLGTPSFVDWAASDYADIPVGFFFLATLALIAIHFEKDGEPQNGRLLGLAGFLAGCAGWTKNEGIVFLIAAAIALLLPVLQRRSETLQRFKAFAAGAAVPLIVIIVFKWTNNVHNYVVAYGEGKLQRIFDSGRHIMILEYAGQYLHSFGAWSISPFVPLIAFILFTGGYRSIFANYGLRTIVAILAIVCAGYYFVYLTTPIELKVHIESSMDRLFLQLWPSVLLVFGLLCKPGLPGTKPALAVANGYDKH
jgi:hypothetical protein